MELVIVRPPLVYGPGVGANFLRLLRLVDRGWPLPLGAVRSQRSLVAVGNLVDLLVRCVDDAAAAGQTLLVSDGQDVTLPQLVGQLARCLGRPAHLLPIPRGALLALARLAGRSGPVARLTSSLQVDMDHTCHTLRWRPPVSLAAGLEATAQWYRDEGRRR
jgi:UDP-glucose 4-epimerase